MPEKWTGETLLELARAYQPASVLLAAAELDLFGTLATEPQTTEQLAATLGGDLGSLALPKAGAHDVVVQAWDADGNVGAAATVVTVR